MHVRQRTGALVLAVAAVAPAAARAQEAPAAPAEINKPFEKPDVKAYIQRFETESREVYSKREAIVRALGLKPGMAVADVGAGTGLFTRLFAERVGPEGKVYAVDIAPAFLEHIAAESKRLGQAQVVTVRGTQDSTGLPPRSVDVAFLCDVYHHLEKPSKTLASIRRALRPGGRLVVIDFDRREGVSTEFVLKHVRAGKDAFRAEVVAAGFEPIEAADAPKLNENFFLVFRKKPEAPATPAKSAR
jgi:predicted methyltransferase